VPGSSPAKTFESRIGLAYDRVKRDEVAGHIEVWADILNTQHVVPLGVFAAIAESAAWQGTASELADDRLAALENSTMLTGAAYDGRISVVAHRLGCTPECWTWDVVCRDDTDRTCAISIVLIAVRGTRPPP
jgi:hypothetical protein